jgi:hypothetical protein
LVIERVPAISLVVSASLDHMGTATDNDKSRRDADHCADS